jgi:hypothetical protein
MSLPVRWRSEPRGIPKRYVFGTPSLLALLMKGFEHLLRPPLKGGFTHLCKSTTYPPVAFT